MTIIVMVMIIITTITRIMIMIITIAIILNRASEYEDLVASMQGQAEQKRVYSKVVFMKTQIIVKQWIYCPSQTDMIFVKFFTHYKCSNIYKSQMFIYDRLHIKSDHGNSFLFCHLQHGWEFSLLFCLFLLGPNLYDPVTNYLDMVIFF